MVPNHPRYQLRYTRIWLFCFLLSVVIYVVKAGLWPGLTVGGNPANARVARDSALCPRLSWMRSRLLPKQARYQLRYTRLFSYSSGWADTPKPLGEKGCGGNRDRKFLIFLRNPPDPKTRKTAESIGKSCLVQFISVGII